MIEVTITETEMFLWGEENRRWEVPVQEWVAARGREKLRDAGIPLRPSFDPSKGPEVTAGRLEWWEDQLGGVRVFRWYP